MCKNIFKEKRGVGAMFKKGDFFLRISVVSGGFRAIYLGLKRAAKCCAISCRKHSVS
jgi:hypothetical protein